MSRLHTSVEWALYSLPPSGNVPPPHPHPLWSNNTAPVRRTKEPVSSQASQTHSPSSYVQILQPESTRCSLNSEFLYLHYYWGNHTNSDMFFFHILINTSCSQRKIRSSEHCLKLGKVAGSATYKQSRTLWNRVVLFGASCERNRFLGLIPNFSNNDALGFPNSWHTETLLLQDVSAAIPNTSTSSNYQSLFSGALRKRTVNEDPSLLINFSSTNCTVSL